MTSRTAAGHQLRSLSLRRASLAASLAERQNFNHSGHPEPNDTESDHHHLIEEEIAQIKRYEDFTTIDWVQDAAREEARQRLRRRRTAWSYHKGRPSWRFRLWELYDAAQGWIVVTLIGACIGLSAAFLNIVTEWLSDIKLGYCTTAFYLNENFCCLGEDNGCAEWHRWTGFALTNYILYIFFAAVFAMVSARLVKSFAPYAAGSGISEIKCIIAGFVMKDFLGFWTLFIKSMSLPLAIASGLSVGKEGPSVHFAVCTGNVISRLFDKYRYNASKTREILSACAAAGVAVAFGSPIGGVLFSLEEISSHFPLKTMWRSYFCALVATAVLAAMNPFRTGALVMFQVRYDRSWHFFEVVFYIVIGIFGGLYGVFVIKWNLRTQDFRKRYLGQYAVLEAVLLAAATAVVCYPNSILRIDMTESMEILFLECEGGEDYHGLCDADKRLRNVAGLVLAAALRTALVIVSYGCRVPAGIFVPSMAIGATFGRTVGILVQALQQASRPGSIFFATCKPDEPCITPGTYAFLGAAAALSGIMHITVSVVVIMFELTGALTYILPTMIVVGVTKVVGGLFGGRGGIADRMIWSNGLPFLDSKGNDNFGVPVSQVMRPVSALVTVPVAGINLAAIEALFTDGQFQYQGFPVVERDHGSDGSGGGGGGSSSFLVGYIGRTELRYAVNRLRRQQRVEGTAPCTFFPDDLPPGTGRRVRSDHGHTGTDTGTGAVDFGRYVDWTPVTAPHRIPLETVLDLFRKVGPRVILIEHHGRLVGLVTVKDCLRYRFKVEAATAGRTRRDPDPDLDKRLWTAICTAARCVDRVVVWASWGWIRLHAEDMIGPGSEPLPP